MIIKSALFIKSIDHYSGAPDTGLPEYAFIGRSNVGKSSLINLLANRSSLAKTSVKPGKTQTINYFEINHSWYMVDLPGYGWARTSKEKKAHWSVMVKDYLLNRTELLNLFILIDCRVEPQVLDIEFINWAGNQELPISLVFTKSDKLSRSRLKANMQSFFNVLDEYWTELPPSWPASVKDGRGRAEILNFIESINKNML